MIVHLITALVLLMAQEEGGPPDPVTLQVQNCFQGKTTDHLAACEKAATLPTSAVTHAHLLVAQALWQEKERPSSALPLLRMAIDVEPHDVTSHLVTGWYLERARRPRAADEEYREVARLAGGSTENVDMDASVLSVLKQSEAELGSFFQAVAQGFERIERPKMASAFYSAAIINWRDATDYTAIFSMYEAALKLTPENPSLHTSYAEALREAAGDLEAGDDQRFRHLRAAAEHLQEAVRLTPDNSRYHFELGRAQLQIGALKPGIQELREALRLQPEYSDAERELKLALLANDGPSLATVAAEQPDTPEALRRLRECVGANGVRGRVACNDALRIGLSNRNAAKAHFYLAESLSGRRAVEEYRGAMESDSSYALPYFRLGQRQAAAEAAMGNGDDAIANLERAVGLQPLWAIGHEALACELSRSGKASEAIAELEKALAREPEDSILQRRLRELQSTARQPWADPVVKKPSGLLFSESGGPSVRGKNPQASGLLLTLDQGTYWVVRNAGTIRVHGPMPEILVPRDSGWWRVGIATSPREEITSEEPQSQFQQIWARPLAATVPTYAEEEAPCSGKRGYEEHNAAIDWLTPDYAGITLSYELNCADERPLAGRSSYVVRVESLRKHRENPDGVNLPDFAGEMSPAGMREAAAIESLRIAAGTSPSEHNATVSIEPDRWGLLREKGQWRLARPAESDATVRYASFDIPLDVPAQVAGRNEISPAWDLIQDAAPDAIDAFSSPSEDFLVVLTPSRLLAFDLTRGAIGKRLLQVPLNAGRTPHVILVQWAAGTTVEEWSETLLPRFRSYADQR